MARQIASAMLFVFAWMSCWSAIAASGTKLPIKSMYVIGDSLSDQGNLLTATTALGAPSHQPGVPDELHYFEGRFSNGVNYIDVLSEKLGIAVTPALSGGLSAAPGLRTTS